MSYDLLIDIPEQEWERYLQECRALEVRPSLSDFSVYLSERNIDEYDYEGI